MCGPGGRIAVSSVSSEGQKQAKSCSCLLALAHHASETFAEKPSKTAKPAAMLGFSKRASRRRESNPHRAKLRQILSLLRLPVPPLRAFKKNSTRLARPPLEFSTAPLDCANTQD